jgi:Polyglycine hydrolase-like, structural repeat
MAFVTTGLTNGGVTTHYRFSYDDSLASPSGPEPARTNAVIAACETDYNLMHGWFGGSVNVTGMTVQVTTQSNGASWSGSATSSTIQLKAQGAIYSNNPAYLRYLIIAEVTEIFMMAQNKGWFQGSNEGSKGEGLSRFLSGQFLAQNGFLGLGIDKDYSVADLWLNSTRQDFVNNAPDDNGYNATNGCTTLFIYYLFRQLGYSINQIVAAAGATLAAVYKNLTGNATDPFPLFKQLLDLQFPSQTTSAVPGPNFDDPWPITPVSYTGVWRGGTDPYYLWINASQDNFLAKWTELAAQNLRLVDLDVTTVNGQRLWSGIWDKGTDGYYLWINANQASFLAKWSELAAQNLRLVSIRNYDGLWAGVWRSGSDPYYLWINASQASFLAKWQELAGQGLRLVDFDVSTVNGQQLWSGVWRGGTDGHYLWINASWSNFVTKWQELAAQNLRLVGIRSYNGLWAGIWRSGTDAYYLWANVSQASFLAKWNELAPQGLRLIDLETMPVSGVAGSTGLLAPATSAASATVGTGGGQLEATGTASVVFYDGADVGGANLDFATAAGPAVSQVIGEGGGSLLAEVATAHQAFGAGEGGGNLAPAALEQLASGGAGEGGGDLMPMHMTARAKSGNGVGGGDHTASGIHVGRTAGGVLSGRQNLN